MKMKYVIPLVDKTFGTLIYAGEGTAKRKLNRNTKEYEILSRSYNLYSDVQKADDVEVILPGEATEKTFQYEEKVTLVNPRIVAEGYKINEKGFTKYLLYADDLIKA